MRAPLLAPLLAFLLWLLATAAAAHNLQDSWSSWSWEPGPDGLLLRAQAQIPAATQRDAWPGLTPQQLQRRWLQHAQRGLRPPPGCIPQTQAPQTQVALRDDGSLAARLAWLCPPQVPLWPFPVEADLLFEQLPRHLHLALAPATGWTSLLDGPGQLLLPVADGGLGASSLNLLGSYLAVGWEHILSGWDHLAFLLAMILVSRLRLTLLWAITGFTLGHSLTIAAATLGWVQPRASWVEALIGFSVFLLALEGLRGQAGAPRVREGLYLLAAALALGLVLLGDTAPGRLWALCGLLLFGYSHLRLLEHAQEARGPAPDRLLIAVTSLFGLAHGLGFAGVLASRGLPPGGEIPALLGFNLGVEFGQLFFVALVWLALVLGRRAASFGKNLAAAAPAARALASAALLGLGGFWFLARVAA